MPSREVSGEGWELTQGRPLQEHFCSTAPGEGWEDISGKVSTEEKIRVASGHPQRISCQYLGAVFKWRFLSTGG